MCIIIAAIRLRCSNHIERNAFCRLRVRLQAHFSQCCSNGVVRLLSLSRCWLRIRLADNWSTGPEQVEAQLDLGVWSVSVFKGFVWLIDDEIHLQRSLLLLISIHCIQLMYIVHHPFKVCVKSISKWDVRNTTCLIKCKTTIISLHSTCVWPVYVNHNTHQLTFSKCTLLLSWSILRIDHSLWNHTAPTFLPPSSRKVLSIFCQTVNVCIVLSHSCRWLTL